MGGGGGEGGRVVGVWHEGAISDGVELDEAKVGKVRL